MGKIRLLFVVESGTDVRLVEGLARHFELELLCRRIVGGVEVSQPSDISVPTTVGPASRVPFAAWLLRRLLSNTQLQDVILVQGYALGALVANAVGRVSRRPVVMLVCSPVELYYRARKTIPSGSYSLLSACGLAALSRLNAALGQRYVVLSDHLADVVRTHGTHRPIDVVPVYGVDLDVFQPGVEGRAELRARLDLPRDKPLLFFSSRIAPEKDAETLLLAVRALRDRGRPVVLVNRSGGYRQILELARSLGIAEHVDAADAVNPTRDLAPLYRAVDLCVQASREEGLGFSPLEALACGTPVVATAVGGLRETIVEGETGWTYPKGDVESLALAIERVLDDPSEARRRTRAGREMVVRRFESHRTFSDLEVVLGGLGVGSR